MRASPNGTDPEVPLAGGTTNRGLVVRLGATVRRPARPTSSATAALLQHLADVGFTGAPRPLGIDAEGREMLSYIPGIAVTPPYPSWALTDEALTSVARLLHRYHQAAATFDPAPHSWPPSPPAPFGTGPVAHNDPNLDNVVFRGGQAVALIDFDLASPAAPVWDVAAAARLWVPLRPDNAIGDSRAGRTLVRLRRFVDAYGLVGADRDLVVDAVTSNHDWSYDIVGQGAAAGRPGFAEYWTQQTAARAQLTRQWYSQNDQRLRAALA